MSGRYTFGELCLQCDCIAAAALCTFFWRKTGDAVSQVYDLIAVTADAKVQHQNDKTDGIRRCCVCVCVNESVRQYRIGIDVAIEFY